MADADAVALTQGTAADGAETGPVIALSTPAVRSYNMEHEHQHVVFRKLMSQAAWCILLRDHTPVQGQTANTWKDCIN